jgi:hypothetical protein
MTDSTFKKYRLLENDTIRAFGGTLYRIEYSEEFANRLGIDRLGGYLESGDNLSQVGDCRVLGDAMVCGYAKVSGDAWIGGGTRIFGNADISGSVKISGNSRIHTGRIE